MWQLLIDKQQIVEIQSLQESLKDVSEIYTKLDDGVYRAKLPANLAFYKNLETNIIQYKAYLMDKVLYEIPDDLKTLVKEEHNLVVCFGKSEDKLYMRYHNLPLLVEEI